MKQSFYDLNYSDLEIVINQNNLNYSAAAVLFNWHYKKKENTQCNDNIAKCSLAFFQDNFDFSLPEIDTVHAPVTAKNFLSHLKKGTFDNALFYRVVRLDNQPKSN